MPSFLFILAALAAEPTIATSSDGTVVGRVLVDAPEAEVRELLSNPQAVRSMQPEVRAVQSTPSGSCQVVDVKTDGPLNTLDYKALRCPTTKGWRETLLQSDDFNALETEWRLTPTPNGTQVEYRVRTELDMAVPDALVQRGVQKTVGRTLVELVKRMADRVTH